MAMTMKSISVTAFAVMGLISASAQAATIIGTYEFTDQQLVDTVAGASNTWFYTGSGYKGYNGSGWIDGSSNATTPSELTDATTSTLFALTGYYPNGYIEFSFDASANVVNGAGSDIALFFIWDQSGNQIDFTLNGHTEQLSLQSVFDGDGDMQVANNILWNGDTLHNQMLSVALVDLQAFGLGDGELLNDIFRVSMSRDSGVDVALSLVGALNTTEVPVPAAAWLLGSGLIGLVAAGRRRRIR